MPFFGPEEASTVLACEPSLAFEILTDYDSYREWMPFVTASRLLAREGDLAIAELGVNVMNGQTENLAIECIHDRDRMVLSRGIGGALPVSKVEWQLSPEGSGRCKVSLAMHPEERWETFLPSHRKFLNPKACLDALRAQVSLFAESDTSPEPGTEIVLQIRETPDGIFAVYLGKKYKLTPVEE